MTHKQLADFMGVSVAAVAIVREILAETSAHSQRALEETEMDHVRAAACWLARYRGCHQAADEITGEIVKEVRARG